MNHPTDKQMMDYARRHIEDAGQLEIANPGLVSRSDENEDAGAYVKAWVWVSDDDVRAALEKDAA